MIPSLEGLPDLRSATNERVKHAQTICRQKLTNFWSMLWRPFFASEGPLKKMKNAFYFTLKVLFIFKIFKFLS